MLATFVHSTAAATGSKSAVASDLAQWAGQQIAVQPSTALPVELSKFSAEHCGSSTCLKWRTETEVSNDYFSIERSREAYSWEEIGRLDGMGHTTVPTLYEFVDEKPSPGVNYYRLKQVDFDGKAEYSIVISINHQNVPELKLYPNPAGDQLSLILDSGLLQNCSVRIWNIEGVIVYSGELLRTNEVIDVDQLKKGTYFLQMEVSGETISRTFLKQ